MANIQELKRRLYGWTYRNTKKFFGVLFLSIFFNIFGILWLTIPPIEAQGPRITGLFFIGISTVLVAICTRVLMKSWKRNDNLDVTEFEDGFSSGRINVIHMETTSMSSSMMPLTDQQSPDIRVISRSTMASLSQGLSPQTQEIKHVSRSVSSTNEEQSDSMQVNVVDQSHTQSVATDASVESNEDHFSSVHTDESYNTTISIKHNDSHTILVKAEVQQSKEQEKPQVKWQNFPKLKPSQMLKDFQPQSRQSVEEQGEQSPQSETRSPLTLNIEHSIYEDVSDTSSMNDPSYETLEDPSQSSAGRSEPIYANVGDHASKLRPSSPTSEKPNSPSPSTSIVKIGERNPSPLHQISVIGSNEDVFDSSSMESLQIDANLSSDSSGNEDSYDFLNASSIFKGQLTRQGAFKKRESETSKDTENAGEVNTKSVYDAALLTPSLVSKVYSPWQYSVSQQRAESSRVPDEQYKEQSRKPSGSSTDSDEWEKVN